jgi:hypothetical protein
MNQTQQQLQADRDELLHVLKALNDYLSASPDRKVTSGSPFHIKISDKLKQRLQ